jgi:DNA invertase Pin-like site-specific DNA recombinase
LFFTGRQHAGENIADMMKHRAAKLPRPIQMCDALSRNPVWRPDPAVIVPSGPARRREIDIVLVWRLEELNHLGVGFLSLTEALDLTTSTGRAMAGLLSVFAAFEHEILRERVRAGLEHARQNGKRLGRPATAAVESAEIRKLHRAGISKADIARRLDIGRTSVRPILADAGSNSAASNKRAGSNTSYVAAD